MSANAMVTNLVAWIRRPFGIGTVVLVLFGAAVVFGLNSTHGMPLVERRVVEVAFEDVSGLNTGDDVRISGSRVGYVDEIKLEDGEAVVVLKLDDPDTQLYQNAHAAKVTDRSGLGQKFVALDPGDRSTGPLRTDATIPARQTVKAEDISQLLDVFDERTRASASVQLRNLGGGMVGHGQDLHAFARTAKQILEDTGTLSEAMASDEGAALEDLLLAADLLSGRMATRHQELAALVDEFATTVDAFAVDSGDQVGQTLDLAPETLAAASAALRSLNAPLADTSVAMRNLRPGARALALSVPDLRGLLREAVDPLERVPAVNEDAEPGVESLGALVEDARPLVTQLVDTGASASPFVSVLGSYAFDISNFYTDAAGALSRGDSAGHWLRILLLPTGESLGVPGSVQRDPYPEPSGS